MVNKLVYNSSQVIGWECWVSCTTKGSGFLETRLRSDLYCIEMDLNPTQLNSTFRWVLMSSVWLWWWRWYWQAVLCRFVAVAVVDMEFLSIDFNPCPPSDGNDPPNYFYNTSRCKPSTTVSFISFSLCCLRCNYLFVAYQFTGHK